MKLLRTLHEKVESLVEGRRQVSLGLYEAPDGSHVYGVVIDGVLEFLGTRREARDYYGTWRDSLRKETQ